MKSYRRPQISVLGSVKDLTLQAASGGGAVGKTDGTTDTGGTKTPKKGA